MWPLTFGFTEGIKRKHYFSDQPCSSAQWPPVACGCCIGQCRYETSPRAQCCYKDFCLLPSWKTCRRRDNKNCPDSFNLLDQNRDSIQCLSMSKTELYHAAAAAAKSLQSCPTLCDPVDGSPPGSPIPETLQAGTPEQVAISLSNAWKWKVKVKSLSHVRLLATPWTAAYQVPPSMGFSRQEYTATY